MTIPQQVFIVVAAAISACIGGSSRNSGKNPFDVGTSHLGFLIDVQNALVWPDENSEMDNFFLPDLQESAFPSTGT